MPDVQSIKKQLHMQQWTAIIEDRLASVSTKALVELVPGSDHNDSIPKIEIPDEKTESFGFFVNGISITVGRDISEELLSKIMRAARNA